MRTVEEILADMQALIDKPDMTADDVVAYLGLETELAQAQAAGSAEPTPEPGAEGDDAADVAPGDAPTASVATRTMATAIRTRHASYTAVRVPAGRPSNRQREDDTQNTAFRAYLRTAQGNADISDLRVNGPEDIGMPRGVNAPRNAQSEGFGPSGGYLVPEGFRTKLVERMKSVGGIEDEAEALSTQTGQTIPWPVIDDTSNVGEIVDENAGNTAGNDLSFDFQDLGAYEFQAGGTGGNALKLPWVLLQDAAFDIEKLLSRLLGERLGRVFAPYLITGTGVKRPLGLSYGITGAPATAATPSYGDLVDAKTAIDKLYWPNAKWTMNQTSLGKVWKITDSHGDPIWRPAAMSGALEDGTLLGHGIKIDNSWPDFVASSGTGTNWGAFGDYRAGYVVRRVQDVAVVVNPWSSASTRQNEYTAWMRADARPQDAFAYKVLAGKA
jgi:HK97 family phage major capsid protein